MTNTISTSKGLPIQPWKIALLAVISINVDTGNLTLCPSPTVPNLFSNEDEWNIQVYPRCHSWSFQSIPINSNSVLLIRVGLAGEYESFEHVQKLCVASTNKFHSCLTHWQRVAIVFVAQLTCCILVILTVFLLYSGCS